ncbi:MAG: hypothetical protein CL947_00840 [Epsilonproteobacteria bacterium]|nr:hypothetical protein [Campylobacterota bacterium]|tara:strand:+ start:2958 stop:3302 length:345 start_codon:yes stop_codon:yes gene_type:complete
MNKIVCCLMLQFWLSTCTASQIPPLLLWAQQQVFHDLTSHPQPHRKERQEYGKELLGVHWKKKHKQNFVSIAEEQRSKKQQKAYDQVMKQLVTIIINEMETSRRITKYDSQKSK